jgi:hypothetical protein
VLPRAEQARGRSENSCEGITANPVPRIHAPGTLASRALISGLGTDSRRAHNRKDKAIRIITQGVEREGTRGKRRGPDGGSKKVGAGRQP